MNKLFRSAGMLLLIAVLVFSLAACGQRTVQPAVESTPTVEPTKEIVVETPPPSPTPTPTPTPSVSVPPVAVTTVPMPMPSVSPTVAVTNEPVPTDANGNPITASPTVSPSATVSPSPTPTPYSYDAAFASTIMPDSVTIPENAQEGFINANGVILRGGPSASAVILGTFDSGTRVAILGTENGWTEVVVNGESGYIKSDYVTRGNYITSNAGSTAADYGSGAVYINNGTGNGMVIVPDGPVSSGNTSAVSVTPTQDDYYFLGIMPD